MERKELVSALKKSYPKVTILGAAKRKTLLEVQTAIDVGVDLIGENYVQEARQKYTEQLSVPLHLIGHLQKNKVKHAVELFDCIQSVDSVELAQEIDKRCALEKSPYPVMIQINIGEEEQKNGVRLSDLSSTIQKISSLQNIKIIGLMCIPPLGKAPEESRPYYKKMKELFDEVNEQQLTQEPITELSMGMSSDYLIAIEEGATIVRLGTVLFGKRT